MFYAVIPDFFDFILTELLFHNRQFCSKDYYWVVAPTILHNKTEIKHKRQWLLFQRRISQKYVWNQKYFMWRVNLKQISTISVIWSRGFARVSVDVIWGRASIRHSLSAIITLYKYYYYSGCSGALLPLRGVLSSARDGRRHEDDVPLHRPRPARCAGQDVLPQHQRHRGRAPAGGHRGAFAGEARGHSGGSWQVCCN